MCEHWAEEQLLEGLEVEEDERTATTLKVLWWVPDIAHTRDLRFKYSKVATNTIFTFYKYDFHIYQTIADHADWTNTSEEWTESADLEHEYTELQPATLYDLRVFVKNYTSGKVGTNTI